ncbi:hypothetical protein KO481_16985 [Nocardia sp. NEAU-G5]|uniref:Uncharacterized protein n=1 Tax=Nocardia albiluteola TaxID=2842303 RepID=A0ABS6AYU7_9NOCA|nr:hypothetical protein [Nocardia albiluteola]MBU3063217.1 hypothetical protein [Nocardia albiluteola]
MKYLPFHNGASTKPEPSFPDGATTTSDSGAVENHEVADLAHRVATARGKVPLQSDPALFAELSEAEIAAERKLAEWMRARRRRQRRRAVTAELTAEKRDRRVALALRRDDEDDARWHRRALASRRRVANPDARLAQLYRRAEWSSRALIGVVVLGMLWAGVNVQHNLVPSGDMADPLYWLSYGFEAMISIPIITIMVVATTAARWGREIARGKVVFLEVALLGVTIALNAGPHLAAGALARAAEAAVAPVMVGVVIWLHAWVSIRYATLIDVAGSAAPSGSVDTIATLVEQVSDGRVAATYAEQSVQVGATDTEQPVTKAWCESSTGVSVVPGVAPPGRQGAGTSEPGATYTAQHAASASAQVTWELTRESDRSRPTEQAVMSGQASPATYTEHGFGTEYQATGSVRTGSGHQPYEAIASTATAPWDRAFAGFGDAHDDVLATRSDDESADATVEIRGLAAEVRQLTHARKSIDTVAEVLWLHRSGAGTPAQIARRLGVNFNSVKGWILTAERITTKRDAVVVQIRPRFQAE